MDIFVAGCFQLKYYIILYIIIYKYIFIRSCEQASDRIVCFGSVKFCLAALHPMAHMGCNVANQNLEMSKLKPNKTIRSDTCSHDHMSLINNLLYIYFIIIVAIININYKIYYNLYL